ncbi:MAG: branched-chain amino acid ABC transporter permease [Kiloniellales bacterium]|nr:branched-chain amino acid ABC transporter permease [Kiloniellales bacterium]
MVDLLGLPVTAIFGQLMIGLINGAFYALLALGLAVIFGLLHVINFAQGALYMLGALVAWLLLTEIGLAYWWALILSPLLVAAVGAAIERTVILPLYGRDPLYGLLLTLGVAMMIEYGVVWRYGSAGMPYGTPEALRGVVNLGFMILPLYRLWVMAASIVVCLVVWHMIERSSVGARLRAATEDPAMAQALGINVPALRTTAFAVGAGIAALAGVLAAPIYQVGPLMGQSLLITVFAVVVIGGMGSIRGAVIAGFSLGLIEGLMRLVYPEGTRMAVFLIMAVVLLTRPEKPIGRA